MKSANQYFSTDEIPLRRGMYAEGLRKWIELEPGSHYVRICRDMEPAKSADFVGPFLRSQAGLAVLLERFREFPGPLRDRSAPLFERLSLK